MVKGGVNVLDKDSIRKLVSENYPLLSILIGVVLVSFSIGPYQNGDTQWEYEAAMGVIKWGMPYVNTFGNIINQPPLGFYTEALFFKVFGSSIDTGVALVTLFGAWMYCLGIQNRQCIVWQANRVVRSCAFCFIPVGARSFEKLPHRCAMSVF